ncbi:MAG TPA: addiction module antidote protein, HigA family [Desulfobacteraceae bacterium]|nr:addiction module antidote protein, HigA family [Desulfobacteraceae bacterium]
MEKLPNIHPGEILNEEFLKPLKISAYRISKETKMPYARILGILKERGRITADTALRLSKFFGTTPDFWLGLQAEYDLRKEKELKFQEINSIHTFQHINMAHNSMI